jgi:hypothetical protein
VWGSRKWMLACRDVVDVWILGLCSGSKCEDFVAFSLRKLGGFDKISSVLKRSS